ncbi:MAG: hypothetical protein KKA73_09310 [Chloroflexi bacterium]|nr:hypothetical protein [Chloroflexota bacterium]
MNVGPWHPRFAEIDWARVAELLGGTLRSQDRESVWLLTRPYGWVQLCDNGGEVNVCVSCPPGRHWEDEVYAVHLYELQASVPYTHDDFLVGAMTLAYRLRQALRGEASDYGLDLDTDRTARPGLSGA